MGERMDEWCGWLTYLHLEHSSPCSDGQFLVHEVLAQISERDSLTSFLPPRYFPLLALHFVHLLIILHSTESVSLMRAGFLAPLITTSVSPAPRTVLHMKRNSASVNSCIIQSQLDKLGQMYSFTQHIFLERQLGAMSQLGAREALTNKIWHLSSESSKPVHRESGGTPAPQCKAMWQERWPRQAPGNASWRASNLEVERCIEFVGRMRERGNPGRGGRESMGHSSPSNWLVWETGASSPRNLGFVLSAVGSKRGRQSKNGGVLLECWDGFSPAEPAPR